MRGTLGERKMNGRCHMRDFEMTTEMTSELTMRWVPVLDADGRARLEARWVPASNAAAPTHAAHATHAA
jgi:hypothetical protein